MRYKVMFKLAAAAMVLSLSCGSSDTGGPPETDPHDDEHVELAVIDTIGVELGQPEYVFGHIVEARRTDTGEILVLDSSTMNIRKFSPGGDFAVSAGRQGTGPGEFQMPRGMAILRDKSVLVSDMGANAISVYNDSLEWVRDITGFFPRPPFLMTAAGDSAVVGMMPAFDRQEGLRGFTIARLEMESEPSVVYMEEMRPFDPSMFGPQGDEQEPVFTSDLEGRVFIARPGSDAVRITGYLSDGEEFLSIDENIEKAEKTEEEIAAEREDYEEFTSRSGRRMTRSSDSYDPAPYRRAVTELGVDADGRLWVRLGTYRYPYWMVYDMEGQLLFTASLEMNDPDLDDMSVRINENGITAWVPDPTTWPRVFIVEMSEPAGLDMP